MGQMWFPVLTVRTNGDTYELLTPVGALEKALLALKEGHHSVSIYGSEGEPLLHVADNGEFCFESKKYRSDILDIFETEVKLREHIAEWLGQ